MESVTNQKPSRDSSCLTMEVVETFKAVIDQVCVGVVDLGLGEGKWIELGLEWCISLVCWVVYFLILFFGTP